MSGKLLPGPWPADDPACDKEKDAIDKIRAVRERSRQKDYLSFTFSQDDYYSTVHRIRIDAEGMIERILGDLPKPQGYCDPDKPWTSITMVSPIGVPGEE